MTRIRRDDGGWVLLTSVMLLSAMFVLSTAVVQIVDVQSGQAKRQRVRETAFNLAEAALNAQIFSLSRDWPGAGSATNQYPNCTGASGSTRCPSNAQVVSLIPSGEAASATWGTTVRDNGGASAATFYQDSTVLAQPGYDANGDGQVWVRATATAEGKTRTLIGLIRAEQQEEDIPHAALITGRLDISNMGNKIIIDASAGSGLPTAMVRCTPVLGELTSCLGHPIGLGPIGNTLAALNTYLGRQLSPNVTTTGYTGGAAMTPEARARLRATAIADGTYYASCPPNLAGHVVYIAAGDCSYTGNTTYNTAANPGVVLMESGSLYIGGTVNYNGILYHANLGNSTGTAITIQGNATIIGGVLVDGPGLTIAGSSKTNIQLSPNAFRAVSSYGAAGVVQNTWREIRPGGS